MAPRGVPSSLGWGTGTHVGKRAGSQWCNKPAMQDSRCIEQAMADFYLVFMLRVT